MFYVDASAELRKRIKHLHQIANEQDRGELFISAFKEIYSRLHHNAFEFGEPLYSLPILRLQIRTGSVLPIVVTYSVSSDHPIVVIKSVELLDQVR